MNWLDKTAWLGAVLTLVAWVAFSQQALAFAVVLPPVPVVDIVTLPPFAPSAPAEVDR